MKGDYMDIGAFHCSQVVKSILWMVIGCWCSEWVYQCVYTLACLICYWFGIGLPPILLFVCQLGLLNWLMLVLLFILHVRVVTSMLIFFFSLLLQNSKNTARFFHFNIILMVGLSLEVDLAIRVQILNDTVCIELINLRKLWIQQLPCQL